MDFEGKNITTVLNSLSFDTKGGRGWVRGYSEIYMFYQTVQ